MLVVPAPRRRRLPPLGALLAAVLVFLLPFPTLRAAAVTGASSLQRTAGRLEVESRLHGWPELRGAGFSLRYPAALASQAPVVAAAIARFAPEVLHDYGLTPAEAPVQAVLVTPAEMQRFVGGPAGDAPLGAFYEGVVWLLAPEAFLPPGPGLAAAYAQGGPVAHELTHLADAVASGGRTPPWLDEGLAQYEDWRLTGYVWSAAGFSAGTYSWSQLNGNFYALPNIALAYRQALAATATLCRAGPGTCVGILHALRSGEPLSQALRGAVGPDGLGRLQAGADWLPGTAPQPGPGAGPVP